MGNLDICPDCNRGLIEIDRHGERLIGCVDCNRWSWVGSKTNHMFMQLPDEDLQVLRNLSDKRHKAEDQADDKS
jgi:hypothetical protein